MKHFDYLTADRLDKLFFKCPTEFTKDSQRDLLAYSLGATLYMPGNRPGIYEGIVTQKHDGLVSMVLCLEDAVSDNEVLQAEINIELVLKKLAGAIDRGEFLYENLPLIFIRIRSVSQMKHVAEQLGSTVHLLSGFIFPKFSYLNGAEYLTELHTINHRFNTNLYGMPILESADVIYKESRMDSLMKIKALLDQNYDRILNVRMGATDFCGLFGIRRSSDSTIYDISVVRDCIADLVNVFGRSEKEYVVSGPVWEYFYKSERVLKPQLRQTPFEDSLGEEGLTIRKDIINDYLDGLIKEVLLDKNNGLTGKTIIHPTHIKPVHAFSAVSLEEYLDAKTIIESDSGVIKSSFDNKMNEMKPHMNWAKKIITKAKVYGVLHEQNAYIELLTEHEHVQV